jgi:hypothetical protein
MCDFYGSAEDEEFQTAKKAQLRAYKFDPNSSSGIDWDDPCLNDLFQDNDTEEATQAYTNKGRTPQVLEVLAAYGFTDFSQDSEQLPSPCFEKVRKHCSQRGQGEPLPSIIDIATEMRAEASEV